MWSINFFPNEIIMDILIHLNPICLIRCTRVCKLWFEIIFVLKSKYIVKPLCKQMKSYLLTGKMEVITYCQRIPFEIKHQLFKIAIDTGNEQLLLYTIHHQYLSENDLILYKYCDTTKIYPIIIKHEIIKELFNHKINRYKFLIDAIRKQNENIIISVTNNVDFTGKNIPYYMVNDLIDECYQSSESIRNYILNHFECNFYTIKLAARYGNVSYLEKNINKAQKYSGYVFGGLMEGANANVLHWFSVNIHEITQLHHRWDLHSHIYNVYIDTTLISKHPDPLFFYGTIFDIIKPNSHALQNVLSNLLASKNNHIKFELIQFVIRYHIEHFGRNFDYVNLEHICHCELDVVKYLYQNGCSLNRLSIINAIIYNRIDILQYLMEINLDIDYGYIMKLTKFYQKINLETLIWIHRQKIIYDPLGIKRLLKLMDFSIVQFLVENDLIPDNVYDTIIFFHKVKIKILDYLYANGYRFASPHIKHLFEQTNEGKKVNSKLLKWFYCHGMPISKEMIKTLEHDNITLHWLAKKLK